MLEFLLKQDQVDVNVKERRGWNLLHLAARLDIHSIQFMQYTVYYRDIQYMQRERDIKR